MLIISPKCFRSFSDSTICMQATRAKLQWFQAKINYKKDVAQVDVGLWAQSTPDMAQVKGHGRTDQMGLFLLMPYLSVGTNYQPPSLELAYRVITNSMQKYCWHQKYAPYCGMTTEIEIWPPLFVDPRQKWGKRWQTICTGSTFEVTWYNAAQFLHQVISYGANISSKPLVQEPLTALGPLCIVSTSVVHWLCCWTAESQINTFGEISFLILNFSPEIPTFDRYFLCLKRV